MFQFGGYVIADSEARRDEIRAELEAFRDADPDRADAPMANWGCGFASYPKLRGSSLPAGPGFIFAMMVKDDDIYDPPEGSGWAGTFTDGVNAIEGCEMATEYSGPVA